MGTQSSSQITRDTLEDELKHASAKHEDDWFVRTYTYHSKNT